MDITSNMIEEAWDIRTTIKDNQYIKLMDLLKDIYDYQSCSINHKIKIYYETKIIKASQEWIETHDEEYDEFHAQDDEQAETITIRTDNIFNIYLKEKINYRNNYEFDSNWEANRLLSSALYEYSDNKLTNPKMFYYHLTKCDSITDSLKDYIFYELKTEKIISYIKFI